MKAYATHLKPPLIEPAAVGRPEMTGKERMQIDALDHLVLTVANIAATCAFYQRVLGMTPVTFGAARKALDRIGT